MSTAYTDARSGGEGEGAGNRFIVANLILIRSRSVWSDAKIIYYSSHVTFKGCRNKCFRWFVIRMGNEMLYITSQALLFMLDRT